MDPLETNTLEVQDQTKNGLLDDPCKGFPTTNGQSLVFGLPANMEPKVMEVWKDDVPFHFGVISSEKTKRFFFKRGICIVDFLRH